MTDYDYPENYIYRPWPIDSFSRKVLSLQRINEVEQNIASVRKRFQRPEFETSKKTERHSE